MKKWLFFLFSFSLFADDTVQAYRASILYFLSDPATSSDSFRFYEDGLLVLNQGKIEAVGSYDELAGSLSKDVLIDDKFQHHLIMPGFIDTHIHYAQTEMIASFGEELLEWLSIYTFPTERQFERAQHAQKISRDFIEQLLQNGTTTALVFGTVHKQSVDALFLEAEKINMRLIAGKVMMDRNAPSYLLDTAKTGYDDSKELIERWHNNKRLSYAVTPRFAPTSSPEQLKSAAKLLKEYPDVYLQTHLSENLNEIKWVSSLFPSAHGYSFGLLGERSIFAHGIYLNDAEFATIAKTQSAIAFCPTSNLFLGSGLFKFRAAKKASVKIGMGTDVGAGTSFNMLQTLNETYKVVLLEQNGNDKKVPL